MSPMKWGGEVALTRSLTLPPRSYPANRPVPCLIRGDERHNQRFERHTIYRLRYTGAVRLPTQSIETADLPQPTTMGPRSA